MTFNTEFLPLPVAVYSCLAELKPMKQRKDWSASPTLSLCEAAASLRRIFFSPKR
jgi:hypothetical protein